MKNKTFFPVLLVVLLGMLLSACTGAPMETSWPGVSATEDTAYLANGAEIYAIRINDGAFVWRYPEKPDTARVYFASPTLADGHLIVGDYKNKLSALDPKNGSFIWSFDEGKGGYIGSSLVQDGVIYAPSTDFTLYAFDLNKDVKWRFPTQNMLWAPPVTDGNFIYQSGMDRTLYAINKATGKEAWSKKFGGALIASPALDMNGSLFVGSLSSEMVALQSATGDELWRMKTDGTVWSQALVINDKVIFGDVTGKVYALDAKTGSVVWNLTLDGVITASPVLAGDNLVFVTETGSIQAVSLDGMKVWTHTIEKSKLYSTPVVVNQMILVPVTMGKDGILLVAVDFNGNQLWSFAPPKK